jgi:hypothetical protein
MDTPYTPCIGYEAITVSTVVIQLTAAQYKQQRTNAPDLLKTAKSVLITTETADIRITFDGTAPAAGAAGHLILAGSSFTIYGYQNIAALKMIRNAAVDAPIRVSYFGG